MRALELYAIGIVLLAALRSVKLHDFRSAQGLSWGDHAGWLAISAAVAGADQVVPGLSAAAALVTAGLLVDLWVDALLFRVFTIELGGGGLRGIVAPVLYCELAELAFARRFLRQNLAFALFPLAALTLAAWSIVPFASVGHAVLTALLLAYASMLLVRAQGASALLPGRGRGVLAGFLLARPLPRQTGFAPRAEHAALLALAPRIPRPSAAHGSLAGANVLLVTIESLGQAQLSPLSTERAHMPFLESLRARGLASRDHFCISPTTNNAHVALHASRYREDGGTTGVQRLARAGLRPVYLTSARTTHYGLRPLLVRAGFETVFDASDLTPHARDDGKVSDHALVEQGPRLLARALDGHGRFFAHVHTANTHVPYRVVDTARFGRHDPTSDLGRFLNGLEEADALVAALLDGLAREGLMENMLVVVSADHGQSFGEMGYRSHASAITREQVSVPFLLHHPALESGEVRWSSHFDVLPTILDLLGLDAPEGFGASVLHDDREPELLLWAGRPSRASTSNFGLLLPDRKLMLDLTTDTCLEMGWHDEDPRELQGAEREYWQALASEVFTRQGLR